MQRLIRKFGLPEIATLALLGVVVLDSAAGVELFSQWAIGLGVGLFYVIAWASWSAFRKDRAEQAAMPRSLWFVSGISIALVTLTTQWPLVVEFWLVRGELDRLADRVEKGQEVETPIRVGAFLIRKVEMRYESYPALMLDPNPSGPTSLVRAKCFTSEGWSRIDLSRDWCLFSED